MRFFFTALASVNLIVIQCLNMFLSPQHTLTQNYNAPTSSVYSVCYVQLPIQHR